MIEAIKLPWPGWQVESFIGKGSFGSVYKIKRIIPGGKTEYAALKMISFPQHNSEIEEYYNEGYTTESIMKRYREQLNSIMNEYSLMIDMKGNTNIVCCDDFSCIQHEDGIGWDVYIRMELLTPLMKTLGESIDEKTVIKIGEDLCNALLLCKQRGIIHRDIKPQNIFVSKDGDYKLGDFGVAKISDITVSGTKTGTFRYMPPEVYNNQPYGTQSDIYSLGLVLYWLLNKKRSPFLPLPPRMPTAEEENKAFLMRVSGNSFPPPYQGNPMLKSVVMKACAYNTAERYFSASEMLMDLQKAANYKLSDSYNSVASVDSTINGRVVSAPAVSQVKPAGRFDVSTTDNTVNFADSHSQVLNYENRFAPSPSVSDSFHQLKDKEPKQSGKGCLVFFMVVLFIILGVCVAMLVLPSETIDKWTESVYSFFSIKINQIDNVSGIEEIDAPSSYEDFTSGMRCKVKADIDGYDYLVIRKEPYSDSVELVRVPSGAIVDIAEDFDSSRGGYIKVYYQKGSDMYEGWISAVGLEFFGDSLYYTKLKKGMKCQLYDTISGYNGLYLRTSPGYDARIIVLVPTGSQVGVISDYNEENGKYIKVRYEKDGNIYEGWILGDYMNFVEWDDSYETSVEATTSP